MKCLETKDDGQQCNANAMAGSDYCYYHNPDITDEEKKDAQTRGGKARGLTIANPLPEMVVAEPNDAILLLADTINRVRTGELDIKTANCLGFLTDKLLRAYEVAKLNDKLNFIEQTVKVRR